MRFVICLSRGLASATLSAAVAFAAARGANADEISSLLERPVSPGSVALLAAHTGEAGVSERLKLSLTNANPEVRGVAARIIDLGGLKDLLPDVATALVGETDADAAVEEVRALCGLGGPPYDETILANAARLAPRLDRELVRIFARARGPESLTLYFGTLRHLSLTASDREAFFRIATRGQSTPLNAAVSMAFGSGDTDSWRAALSVATQSDRPVEQPVLVRALRSPEAPVFRGEAAWYLAKTSCGKNPYDAEELLASVGETGTTAGDDGDPELRFGIEMLRRVLGKVPVEDEGWIACLESNLNCHLDSDFGQSPLIDYLTPREHEAVLMRNNPGARKSGSPPGVKKTTDQLAEKPNLRLVTGHPRGAARDLFDIVSCRPTGDSRLSSVADLEFRGDGLPRRVSLTAVPNAKWCSQIAETLFLLSLAPADDPIPETGRLTYATFFGPDSVVCSEGTLATGSAAASGDVLRVRAAVVAPRLIKKIEPAYPAASRKNREKGVSIYEAVISATGCVRDLRLLRSSFPSLDLSGIGAISQWKYAPATLNGRPVGVYLTVTVTYSFP